MNIKSKRKQKNRFFKLTLIILVFAVAAVCIWTAASRDTNILCQLISGFGVQKKDEWCLILVNKDNPVPENYQVTLKTLKNGDRVDERIYPDLQDMFDAMRSVGIYPHINSAYRSPEKQQQLLDDKIAAYKNEGHSDKEARRLAKLLVSTPESSEHLLGLALDLTAEDNSGCSVEDVQKWLRDNAYKYGFIMRYPEDKTEITGYSYEPWHYRYVGKSAALSMYIDQICLEEYLGKD